MWRHLVSSSLLLLISACGTTSGLETPASTAPAEGQAQAKAVAKQPAFVPLYDNVLVGTFADRATEKVKFKGKTPEEIEQNRNAYQSDLETSSVHFSDMIVTEISKTNLYQTVQRGAERKERTLLIDGDITRFDRGDSMARLWIGFGAGSAYFDAVIRARDAMSGEVLGEIVADRNSWALGGGIAAGQSVETFMTDAAKKVATELQKARERAMATASSTAPAKH
jgi:hypothetical protein